MARNRQRAKERRIRRSESPAPHAGAHARDEAAPSPLGHATPDVEIAEAQMALGRPELAGDGAERMPEPDDDFDGDGEEPVDEDELDDSGYDGDDGPPSGREVARRSGGSGDGEGEPHALVHAERVPVGRRLVNFVQGSWRELQRVQWPDRRQVMQATGVVIGFVIVAGVFLGVADYLAGKLVNLILK